MRNPYIPVGLLLRASGIRVPRTTWVRLVALALVLGVMESISALLLYAFLSYATSPGAGAPPPVSWLGVGGRRADMILEGAFIVAFFLIRAVALVRQAVAQQRLVQGVGVQLVERLVDRYLNLPYVQFMKRDAPAMLQHCTNNVALATGSLVTPAITLTSDTFMLAVLIAVLFAKASAAALIAVGVMLPAVVLIMRIVLPRTASAGSAALSAGRDGYAAIQDALGAIREVQVYSAQDAFLGRAVDAAARQAHATRVRMVLTDVPRITVEFSGVAFIVVGIIAAFVAGQTAADLLPTIGLLSYAVLRSLPTVGRIVGALNTMRFGLAATTALIDEFESAEPSAHARTGSKRFGGRGSLCLANVTVGYEDDVPILTGVDVEFGPTDKVAVTGASGAGKSTLIDVICGLVAPWNGDVFYDGERIQDDLSRWREQVALVSQNPMLIAGSVAENVALAHLASSRDEARIWEALHLAALDEFVRELPLGIHSPIGYFNAGVSGGQRQRLAIARAHYADPAILILDEATSALDRETAGLVVGRLWDAYADRCLIVSTHHPAVAAQCDRVLAIASGTVTEASALARTSLSAG